MIVGIIKHMLLLVKWFFILQSSMKRFRHFVIIHRTEPIARKCYYLFTCDFGQAANLTTEITTEKVTAGNGVGGGGGGHSRRGIRQLRRSARQPARVRLGNRLFETMRRRQSFLTPTIRLTKKKI